MPGAGCPPVSQTTASQITPNTTVASATAWRIPNHGHAPLVGTVGACGERTGDRPIRRGGEQLARLRFGVEARQSRARSRWYRRDRRRDELLEDVGRSDEGTTLAPTAEVTLGIGTLFREAATALEQRSHDADRAAASCASREPRRGDSLSLQTVEVQHGENLAGDLIDRGGPTLDRDQGAGWFRRSDSRVGREILDRCGCRGSQPGGYHLLCLLALREPSADLADVGCRGRKQDRQIGRVLIAELPRQVGSEALVVGDADPVGLVDDDRLARQPADPTVQIPVVEHRILVLLRIGDPQDRVHARQQLVHPRSMRWLDGIEVGQVEDQELIVLAVAAGPLVDLAQPVDERTRGVEATGRNPRDRNARRRASGSDGTDLRACERVEQARLADTGPADERQYVEVIGQCRTFRHALGDRPRVARRNAEAFGCDDRGIESRSDCREVGGHVPAGEMLLVADVAGGDWGSGGCTAVASRSSAASRRSSSGDAAR